jgi:putative heme-binding domain-containing protein
MAADRHPLMSDVAGALLGRVRLDADPRAYQLLERCARTDLRYRTAVVEMVVAAGPPNHLAGALLQSAAIDPELDVELRASVYGSLASATGPDALRRAIDAFVALVRPELDPPLESAWRQFTGTSSHAANVTAFRVLAAAADPARQRLAFAVLLQLAADPPAAGRGQARGRGGDPQTVGTAAGQAGGGLGGPGAAGGGRGAGAPGAGGRGGGRGRGANEAVMATARADARALIDGAWEGPAAASLVWAVGRTGAVRYRDRVEALATSSRADVREAATYATARLAALSTPAAGVAMAGPRVASIPYEDLVMRLATVTGDVVLGRKLFEQQGCAACHTTAPGEPEKGPYLGGIFTRYSRAEILESILRPGARVAQGFATNWFTTTDRRQLSGFVVREGQDDVVIRDLTGAETTLRKTQIASRGVNEGSTMPPGLVDTLTLQELASLLALLESTAAK